MGSLVRTQSRLSDFPEVEYSGRSISQSGKLHTTVERRFSFSLAQASPLPLFPSDHYSTVLRSEELRTTLSTLPWYSTVHPT